MEKRETENRVIYEDGLVKKGKLVRAENAARMTGTKNYTEFGRETCSKNVHLGRPGRIRRVVLIWILGEKFMSMGGERNWLGIVSVTAYGISGVKSSGAVNGKTQLIGWSVGDRPTEI
jgi:hypothetical protein